ncbi:MAG: flippase-like domain-containing protein, partial [Bacteroidales bacterium]|nr:flippase-like domain-containing protein [Bacteroidales bacterium]
LPRVGEITRCIALGRKEKIPVDQLIGTVVIERGIDIISLAIITLFMLIVDGATLGPFLRETVIAPVREKMINLFGFPWMIWVLSALFLILVALFFYVFRQRLGRIRFFSKLFKAARGVITGLSTFMRVRRKKEFVFHTIFIWFNYAMMTWVVVFSLKSTSHLDFADGMFLLVIGGLAMSAPVQSGLGAFHFIISRGLNAVYGISLEDGLAYALLAHESQLIFGMILGFIALYSLVRKDKIKLTADAEE